MRSHSQCRQRRSLGWAVTWFFLTGFGAYIPIIISSQLLDSDQSTGIPPVKKHSGKDLGLTISSRSSDLPTPFPSINEPIPNLVDFSISGMKPSKSEDKSNRLPRTERHLHVASDRQLFNEDNITSRLEGSLLLGGLLTLDSLNEKEMVPYARVEQIQKQLLSDRLASVPWKFRERMRSLIGAETNISPLKIVRIPARHLKESEEIPMILSDAIPLLATINHSTGDESQQLVRRWLKHQASATSNQVTPVIVILEPLSTSPDSGVQQTPANNTHSSDTGM